VSSEIDHLINIIFRFEVADSLLDDVSESCVIYSRQYVLIEQLHVLILWQDHGCSVSTAGTLLFFDGLVITAIEALRLGGIV